MIAHQYNNGFEDDILYIYIYIYINIYIAKKGEQ